MEGVLARCLGHVLVGADTCSFQCLAGKLFIFVGDKMAAEWEVVDGGTLASQVEDADLTSKLT